MIPYDDARFDKDRFLPKGCTDRDRIIGDLSARLAKCEAKLNKWEAGQKLFMGGDFGDSIPEVVRTLKAQLAECEREKRGLQAERDSAEARLEEVERERMSLTKTGGCDLVHCPDWDGEKCTHDGPCWHREETDITEDLRTRLAECEREISDLRVAAEVGKSTIANLEKERDELRAKLDRLSHLSTLCAEIGESRAQARLDRLVEGMNRLSRTIDTTADCAEEENNNKAAKAFREFVARLDNLIREAKRCRG